MYRGEFNPYDKFDSEENRKAYETEQRQRALERRIRKTKREVMGLQAASDNALDETTKAELDLEYQRKAALLQKQNKAYKDYCKEHGLKELRDRIDVARWDKKQAAAARGAAKKWNNQTNKTSKKSTNITVNLAKAADSMEMVDEKKNAKYQKEEILKEMQKSPIGLETIRAIRDTDAHISIYDRQRRDGVRGEQQGSRIGIYSQNIKSVRVAGQTLIHEMAHYRFNIGGCQHAEAICFAMEKMHITGKTYLTESEWEYVKELAIVNYPEYNWEEGGYGNYEQFDFVKPDNYEQ